MSFPQCGPFRERTYPPHAAICDSVYVKSAQAQGYQLNVTARLGVDKALASFAKTSPQSERFSRFTNFMFFATCTDCGLARNQIAFDLSVDMSTLKKWFTAHKDTDGVYVEALVRTASCPIPDVCFDERRLPPFIARATLRDLIAGLKARATGGAAR